MCVAVKVWLRSLNFTVYVMITAEKFWKKLGGFEKLRGVLGRVF